MKSFIPGVTLDSTVPRIDFSHIVGNNRAKRALIISLLGGYDLAIVGPRHTCKTTLMLAYHELLGRLDLKSPPIRVIHAHRDEQEEVDKLNLGEQFLYVTTDSVFNRGHELISSLLSNDRGNTTQDIIDSIDIPAFIQAYRKEYQTEYKIRKPELDSEYHRVPDYCFFLTPEILKSYRLSEEVKLSMKTGDLYIQCAQHHLIGKILHVARLISHLNAWVHAPNRQERTVDKTKLNITIPEIIEAAELSAFSKAFGTHYDGVFSYRRCARYTNVFCPEIYEVIQDGGQQ